MTLKLRELTDKTELFGSGHALCAGCAEPVAVRQVLECFANPGTLLATRLQFFHQPARLEPRRCMRPRFVGSRCHRRPENASSLFVFLLHQKNFTHGRCLPKITQRRLRANDLLDPISIIGSRLQFLVTSEKHTFGRGINARVKIISSPLESLRV